MVVPGHNGAKAEQVASTGLGKLHLNKEGEAQRYWMAICLYLNMAFGMFWLSGQAAESGVESRANEDGTYTIVIEPSR